MQCGGFPHHATSVASTRADKTKARIERCQPFQPLPMSKPPPPAVGMRPFAPDINVASKKKAPATRAEA